MEEYNEGYEFNMMSWVLDGTVHVISIADREKTLYAPMIFLSVPEMYILPGLSLMSMRRHGIFCNELPILQDRQVVFYPCSFSGLPEKAYPSVRLPVDSLVMNMNL